MAERSGLGQVARAIPGKQEQEIRSGVLQRRCEMGAWAKTMSRRGSGCYGEVGAGAEEEVALDDTAAFGPREQTQG